LYEGGCIVYPDGGVEIEWNHISEKKRKVFGEIPRGDA
jgi:hypothetical protein